MAGGGPHQPAAVVVDDDHQILVAAAVRDLVDPDPHQPVERIPSGPGIGDDPAGDRPDAAPGDAHQLDHRRLRAVRHQPGDLIVEGSGVPGAVTGPRHRGHRHPMLRAAHPRRLGLDEHPHRAGIQRPPAAPPLTLVVAAAPPIAATAATASATTKTTRHDDLLGVVVELDRLDHHRCSTPITRAHTLFDCTPLSLALFPAFDSRKAKPGNGVHPRMVSYTPTERDGEPQMNLPRLVWEEPGA